MAITKFMCLHEEIGTSEKGARINRLLKYVYTCSSVLTVR